MTPQEPPADRDGPRDECGVFGTYAPEQEVARLAYFALYALQHRGQESAGIATSENGHIMTLRDLGLVSQVFDEPKLRALSGDMAVGHVRYSTTGSSAWENAQPIYRSDGWEVALAHNGNLTNAVELHAELRERGVGFRSTSDSEIIAALISTHSAGTVEEALVDVIPRLRGAFSTVVMTHDGVVAFRDGAGLRPLSIGRLGDRFCFASESCAFDIIGAEFMRDVLPGELVSLSERGLESRQVIESARRAFCVFEHIYFARPDSVLEGVRTQVARRRMGEMLAREAPVEADVVVPVPDSGVPAAIGYAQAAGIPFELGIIRNHYVGRTFISPGDSIRHMGVKLKHNANRRMIEGKRIVLVDDSIVRGTTSQKIVQMVRDAGAREVHMRIASPPTRASCFYGVDTPEQSKLLASRMSVEEMAEFIRVDSLGFLSIEGLYRAVGEATRNADQPQFCDACFTGQYPTRLLDHEGADNVRTLSLLANAAQ